jgi:TolB-like protein/Tfp pilus assembly protein PilF
LNSTSQAVFISYASEDADAAARIAAALQGAGIGVWFDQSELRGGDAWDQTIRQRIRECRLFIPVISAHTEARDEGYFRREWGLAVDRTRDMEERKAFVLPVVIDDTPERNSHVPEKFHHVQWTRLPGGSTPPGFVTRVAGLTGATAAAPSALAGGAVPASAPTPARGRRTPLIALVVGILAVAGMGAWFALRSAPARRPAAQESPAQPPAVTTDKSIAVLPFVDMSEHHDQEYYSDGLTEELISRLAQTPELKVIARTSSFQFKGKSDDVRIIAGKLAVANLIEGSIRRSGAHVRVTVQLVRAADGAHIWSQSYDREERDVLKVQDEIAESVAKALAVSLHLDAASTPSMSDAYALFLRGREIAEHAGGTQSGVQAALKLFEDALQKDPQLGIAWADQSRLQLGFYLDHPETSDRNAARATALQAAERALRLAPQLAESHLALARILMYFDWEWARAEAEMQRALELGPGNAVVQRNAFYLSTFLGRWDEALQHATKAAALDPLGVVNLQRLGIAQANVYAFAEAERSYRKSLNLDPSSDGMHSGLAATLWYQGRKSEAVAENDREPDEASKLFGQAYLQLKIGHPHESTRALNAFVEKYGRSRPFDVGSLYAELGQLDEAFRWWDRAISERDVGAASLLTTTRNPDIPGIGSDPRFKALVKRMKLPD